MKFHIKSLMNENSYVTEVLLQFQNQHMIKFLLWIQVCD